MANALYTSYKVLLWTAAIDVSAVDIKASINDHSTDTPNPASDDFYNDINTGSVADSPNFASKTFTAGAFDADDVVLPTVTGASCESINIRYDTGTPSTSPMMIYLDTGTNIPFTPAGGDVTIEWDSGANKIAKF